MPIEYVNEEFSSKGGTASDSDLMADDDDVIVIG